VIVTSIFRSAITASDGKSVDPGYLAMYWGMAVTVAMIPATLLVGFWMAFASPADAREKILSSTAMIVGALGVQGAAIIAAVGVFRMGDKDRAPPPPVAPPSMVSMPNAEVTVNPPAETK